MTSSITGTYNSTQDNTGSSNGSSFAESASLQKEDFLKLLIAQMKNQDPLSPTDNTQFVAQLAQFSALEQMTNVASAVEELKESMVVLNSMSLLTQGAALIGKEVDGTDSDGNEISGTVNSVKWLDGSLTLMLGDTPVKMENIQQIGGSAL